jgi:hypothetical protein
MDRPTSTGMTTDSTRGSVRAAPGGFFCLQRLAFIVNL